MVTPGVGPDPIEAVPARLLCRQGLVTLVRKAVKLPLPTVEVQRHLNVLFSFLSMFAQMFSF